MCVQGEMCDSMFFVSYGTLARVVPHDAVEFDDCVTAVRVAHLNGRGPRSFAHGTLGRSSHVRPHHLTPASLFCSVWPLAEVWPRQYTTDVR